MERKDTCLKQVLQFRTPNEKSNEISGSGFSKSTAKRWNWAKLLVGVGGTDSEGIIEKIHPHKVDENNYSKDLSPQLHVYF